jgi:AcrR family transcriptional regulator
MPPTSRRPARSARRVGAEDSTTRAALLDAAQRLMLDEGYASVTSRRVAAKAKLKPQLVHYYFRTMDDLFLALFRRGAEQNLVRQERALASAQPLRALWAFSSERAGATLTMEFAALANHRKAIRAEIAAYAERFRRLQADALARVLDPRASDAGALSPATLPVLITAISRILAMEEALGVTTGHAETRAVVERELARLERAAAGSVARRTPKPARRTSPRRR